jgi:hypothetical protein
MIPDETVNSQIISAVAKWGAITHDDLYFYLNLNSKFSTFQARVCSLIKKQSFNNVKLATHRKRILSASEGTRLLVGNDLILAHKNQLSHDSSLSNICIKLLQLRNVYDISIVRLEDSLAKQNVLPDAEILVSAGDSSINIAIEYELTQKSKNRINQKFLSYSQNNEYQSVLYFFDKEREAVVYANTLHVLESSKLNQHSSLKKEKFYFFVRNKTELITDFFKSFTPIYPADMSALVCLLDAGQIVN